MDVDFSDAFGTQSLFVRVNDSRFQVDNELRNLWPFTTSLIIRPSEVSTNQSNMTVLPSPLLSPLVLPLVIHLVDSWDSLLPAGGNATPAFIWLNVTCEDNYFARRSRRPSRSSSSGGASELFSSSSLIVRLALEPSWDKLSAGGHHLERAEVLTSTSTETSKLLVIEDRSLHQTEDKDAGELTTTTTTTMSTDPPLPKFLKFHVAFDWTGSLGRLNISAGRLLKLAASTHDDSAASSSALLVEHYLALVDGDELRVVKPLGELLAQESGTNPLRCDLSVSENSQVRVPVFVVVDMQSARKPSTPFKSGKKSQNKSSNRKTTKTKGMVRLFIRYCLSSSWVDFAK